MITTTIHVTNKMTTVESPLLKDFLEFQTAEERLEWLYERQPQVPLLNNIGENFRIKECLSNLWFDVQIKNEKIFLSCKSDSKIIQGILAFICDEFDGLKIFEARIKFETYPFNLFETLLSTNRRIGFKKILSLVELRL